MLRIICQAESFVRNFTKRGIFSEDGTVWRELDRQGGGCTLRWIKSPRENFPQGGIFHGG